MPERHDHHHIFLIFIIFFTLTLLSIVGIFAYDLFFDGNARTVMRVELNEAVIDEGFIHQVDRIAESATTNITTVPTIEETEDTIATRQFSGSPIRPGFLYPNTWHIFVQSQFSEETHPINRIILDENPVQIIDGKLQGEASITIDLIDISQEGIAAGTWSETYAAGIPQSQEQIIPTIDIEGSLHLIQSQGEKNTSFFIYDNGVTAVVGSFIDASPLSDDNEAWNIITSSINFSYLQ